MRICTQVAGSGCIEVDIVGDVSAVCIDLFEGVLKFVMLGVWEVVPAPLGHCC
jgi:hypothetical protein